MGRKAKAEVAKETALRTLFTTSLTEALKEDKIKMPKKEQADFVDHLLNTAGAAIEQLVDSFVDIALSGGEEGEEEEEDEEEEEEDSEEGDPYGDEA